MMTLEKFKQEIKNLNNEIREQVSLFDDEIFPIYDGALHPTEYFNSQSFKILWLMKEAYEIGGREGDWSLAEFYENDFDGFLSDLIRGGSKTTWQPVVYASYGILNDFALWDDIPFIRNKPSIAKALNNVAWVNINKLPSLTETITDMGNIYQAYNKDKHLINKQIQLLNPDIIICANTIEVVKQDWGIQEMTKYNSVEYTSINDKLIINAYHPAQRTIGRIPYVNDIVNCARKWHEGVFNS